MSNIPEDLKYTKDHEWLKLEGEQARIGITDYAQGSLGDITFVEMPEVGDTFAVGDTFGVVESVKAASDLYMPVTAEVLEINQGLEDAPEKVNEDAFNEGWMVVVKIKNPAELENLLDAAQYKELL